MTEKEKTVMLVVNEIREANGLPTVDDIFGHDLDLRKDLELASSDLAVLTARLEDFYEMDICEDGIVQTVDEVVGRLG